MKDLITSLVNITQAMILWKEILIEVVEANMSEDKNNCLLIPKDTWQKIKKEALRPYPPKIQESLDKIMKEQWEELK